MLVHSDDPQEVAEGERMWRSMVDFGRRLVARDNPSWAVLEGFAFAVGNISDPSQELIDQALDAAHEATILCRGTVNEGQALLTTALVLEKAGMASDAERCFQEAIEATRPAQLGIQREAVAGRVRLAKSRGPSHVEGVLRDALERAESRYPEGHDAIELPRLQLGEFLVEQGKPKEAESYLTQVVERLANDEHAVGAWKERADQALARARLTIVTETTDVDSVSGM